MEADYRVESLVFKLKTVYNIKRKMPKMTTDERLRQVTPMDYVLDPSELGKLRDQSSLYHNLFDTYLKVVWNQRAAHEYYSEN